MTGSADPSDTYAALVQRPQMRPWVGTRFGLRLSYVDEAGRPVCLALTARELAQLALSIAEAQAEMIRQCLDAPDDLPS